MNAPIEPSADIRQADHGLREMYISLTAEDFTEQQALIIIGQVIAANSGGQ